MQRKVTLIADIQSKILSHTTVAFYDKDNNYSFRGAVRRRTFFLNYE